MILPFNDFSGFLTLLQYWQDIARLSQPFIRFVKSISDDFLLEVFVV